MNEAMGTFDSESEDFALSDCIYYGLLVTDCSGPRVGRVTGGPYHGKVMCEGHFNDPPIVISGEEKVRHMYDMENNDLTKPLCHNLLTGGAVIRGMIAVVNCQACLDLYERMLAEPNESEKLYLVCISCGEAFDDIEIAYRHQQQYDPENDDEHRLFDGFEIRTESEAM